MKNDLKLKTAAEEIKDILRKYEITGSVAMYAEGGFGEYFNYITAPYSVAYMYSDNEVRFYSKLKDFPNKEAQLHKTTETAGMLNILCDLNGHNFMFIEQLYSLLKTKFDIEHWDRDADSVE